MPPIIVARSPSAFPNLRPANKATVQHSAVVIAIKLAANSTLIESAAKLTPTASASILVAIA